MSRRLYSVNFDGENIEQNPQSNHNSFSEGSGGGGGNMLEARVAKLEADVSYIRRDVDELRVDVKTISQNMTIAIERLDNIRTSLDKKPSTDTVDKKITDAKLAILLGVPAIIAIGTGIYKIALHYL
ncbi:hypothetical protein ACR76C_10375 [Klebsiella grimontii]|uniref:hypothetical protein n=1 Tax=Klebsiella grimontii TaxID=2058152 RepID=UPI001CCCB7F5|nr:hypothetical protein [Klebsiella grimontii]MDU2497820.1 hypothetical protein [Klebsiella grimontii]